MCKSRRFHENTRRMTVLFPSEPSGAHHRISMCARFGFTGVDFVRMPVFPGATEITVGYLLVPNNRLASASEKRAKLRTGSSKSRRMRRGDVAEWLKAKRAHVLMR